MERRRRYCQISLNALSGKEKHWLNQLRCLPIALLIVLIYSSLTSPAAQKQESKMHIQFERTGGVAGMRLTITIDSDSISSEDAAALRDMIHSASFFELPAKSQKSQSGADRFQYKVIVEIDERRHTIEIEESAVPASLRPLLNWLTEKAKSR